MRGRSFQKGYDPRRIAKGTHRPEETKRKISASNKGRIISEETRKKISETLTGRKLSDERKAKMAGRKGVPCSEETKKRISEANSGRVMSAEARKKMSDAKKGKRLSPSTEFQKGSVSPRKGVKLSNEERASMSEVRKGQHFSPATEMKKGNIPWNFGKPGHPQSEEQRKKTSERMKGYKPSADTVKKMLARRTPTTLEMKFLKIVEKNALPYKFVGDGSFMIGRKNPDFINTNGEKIAIEVYSLYYKLRHAETVDEWKKERQNYFGEHGWEVLFFDAVQVNETNVLKELRAA